MGGNGKPKQAQRTKNNEKPSNSGRSAELLGNSIASFVSLNTGFGLLPSGFAMSENLPENFDSSVNTQYQVVLRKMSKKDPITKVKALQAFVELINESELDVIKTVLPVWSKFYNNLANDTDPRVREFAQQTHNVICIRTGKFIAPFLKQLCPVWLSSQYDNYPPASSMAIASFKAAFSPVKIEEVCLFCQTEILDFLIRNITWHSPATLGSNTACSQDELEHKYQRIVVSSFKTFAFFMEHTHKKLNEVIEEKCSSLFDNPKFWSFSKHRSPNIKASWFEAAYAAVHYNPNLIIKHKEQLIQVTFKNMDDDNPIVLSHVWQCILAIQAAYPNWIEYVDFRKTLIPKLSGFFKNGANGNLTLICPNLLPFISSIYGKTIKNITAEEFYETFFSMIKDSITTVMHKSSSRSECSALSSSFFECLRYIILKKNMECNSENTSEIMKFVRELFENNVVIIMKFSLSTDAIIFKSVYLHLSALIAFWSNNLNSTLYLELSKQFWSESFLIIAEKLSINNVHEQCLGRIVDLINCLFNANPYLQENKVKFICIDDENNQKVEHVCKEYNTPSVTTFIQTDLQRLVIELTHLCLLRAEEEKSVKYLDYIEKTAKLYADYDFFAKISGSDVSTTLNIFKKFLGDEYAPTETVTDIIFQILKFVDKNKRLEFLNDLLSINNHMIIFWALQHMLSYPLCVEPEIHTILSQKRVSDFILKIAENFVYQNSKESLNLLHKCFFLTETGDVLISKFTADGVLEILTKPLVDENLKHMIEICGSFVSQVMPIVPNESTFIKLYEFSINSIENEYLSSDTLWEITTCWQDALSSGDIEINEELLDQCGKIITNRLYSTKVITASEISKIGEMVSKLIIFATENIDEEEARVNKIDSIIETIIIETEAIIMPTYNSIVDLCSFLEVIKGSTSASKLRINNIVNDNTITNFLKKTLFQFSLILKLINNKQNSLKLENIENEENVTGLTWSKKIYEILLKSLKDCAIGELFMSNLYLVSDENELLILTLSEEIKKLLKSLSDKQTSEIKQQLFDSIIDNDVPSCRALPLLLHTPNWKQYQESAAIILLEEISECIFNSDSFSAYVYTLQMMLPYLTPKAISIPRQLDFSDNMLFQIGTMRCLILNYFDDNKNNVTDIKIISRALSLVQTFALQKGEAKEKCLLYNTDVSKADMTYVVTAVEFIHLLTEIINRFYTQLGLIHWDIIRIGLSSWVLSTTKSLNDINNPKVSIFVSAVYKLFSALTKLIQIEKTKSSTDELIKMIDEWQNLFEREVNLVLFDNFMKAVEHKDKHDTAFVHEAVIEVMGNCMENSNIAIIFNSYKASNSNKLDNLIEFVLVNLSNPIHSVKCSAMLLLKRICPFLINIDSDILEKKVDQMDRYAVQDDNAQNNWHFLSKFRSHLDKYNELICPYTVEFSFKLTEIGSFQPVDRNLAINYFIIWDCIIHICHSSSAELRSVYARWLYDNKYEQNFLNFLIRTMPVDILKNHDKLMNNNIFRGLSWLEIKNPMLDIEKYSCHLYMEILRRLPVVVRKWWNGSQSRQKTFVDKLTTNYVSSIICQEELDAISNKMEKQKNMQVKIHSSTREVKASYLIDEVRMEIGIILSTNYPLGSVKVDIGKQIGGRASWRNVGMQLTIFLTHQNGSIYDGLTLWKKNLDKKFEGVEECYICYTVIHQDTCQFPKLTCSTCRKKFHGPCLYKWFTTSNKSTCPICRNIF